MEADFIAWLQEQSQTQATVFGDFTDDAAIISADGILVVTTDAITEDVDFILDEVTPEKGIVLESSAIDKVTNEESTGRGSFPEEWTRLIADIKGIPEGGKPFLRACRAYEGKNGEFVIHGPSEDVIEKIKEERSRIAIEKQLNQVFSGNVKIVYVADNKKDLQDGNDQDPEERLTALIEKDPNLEQVVKELNLELLD